jgi:hypothetical protein
MGDRRGRHGGQDGPEPPRLDHVPRMMPHDPGMMMDRRTTDDQAEEIRQLMMQAGKLAWGDPMFREQLHMLVNEFMKDAGPHQRGVAPNRIEAR